MMMTRHDAETIARDVHAHRPDWDTAGVLAALARVRDRGTTTQLHAVALAAALDPRNRTPRIIELDGPHWSAAHPTTPTGPAPKCPTHTLEEPCRSCRADRLATGQEAPIGPRARIDRALTGACCGTPHAHHAPCPGHTPAPDGWRQMITAATAHYARRAERTIP